MGPNPTPRAGGGAVLLVLVELVGEQAREQVARAARLVCILHDSRGPRVALDVRLGAEKTKLEGVAALPRRAVAAAAAHARKALRAGLHLVTVRGRGVGVKGVRG